MKFCKMHGLGNDFVVIDGFEETIPEEQLPVVARSLCDRHFGVGADGVILVLPSKIANFRMRIINADGSEAEMCGNGIRCFARYVRHKGLATEDSLEVETLAGTIRPQIIGDDRKETRVRVDMGEARFRRKDVVLEGDDPESVREHVKIDGARYDITALSMGNPHCVMFVNDVEHFPVEKVGRQISERKSLFPEGVNVEFVQVLSRAEIRMRVWERGAGETQACGTGACAAAAASAANGFSNRKVTVRLPGGSLSIEWLSTNRVMMTGPAVDVFWAEAPDLDALVEPLLAGKSEKE